MTLCFNVYSEVICRLKQPLYKAKYLIMYMNGVRKLLSNCKRLLECNKNTCQRRTIYTLCWPLRKSLCMCMPYYEWYIALNNAIKTHYILFLNACAYMLVIVHVVRGRSMTKIGFCNNFLVAILVVYFCPLVTTLQQYS